MASQTNGDVQHWISPVIGMIRLVRYNGEMLTDEQIDGILSRLFAAHAADEGKSFEEQQEIAFGGLTDKFLPR